MLDIESGNVHEVLSIAPDTIGMATVSHDPRTLYFTRVSFEADIWMLTLNEEQ
jgi:hypothetical protein